MEQVKFAFEDLKVYQKSLDFMDEVYNTCESFPREEIYKLTSQFARAANSIALNIAEGAGDSNPQFNRYLQISLNTIKECVVCVTIAKRRGYIDENTNSKFRKDLTKLSKMITSLKKYLKNTKD